MQAFRRSQEALAQILALAMQGQGEAGIVQMQQALAVARRQQAQSWALRVAMDLSRLWKQQGKRAEPGASAGGGRGGGGAGGATWA